MQTCFFLFLDKSKNEKSTEHSRGKERQRSGRIIKQNTFDIKDTVIRSGKEKRKKTTEGI